MGDAIYNDCISQQLLDDACSSYNKCKSALYDDRKEMCYLYSTTESFTCERKSDQTYIEKIGNASESNVGTIISQMCSQLVFYSL